MCRLDFAVPTPEADDAVRFLERTAGYWGLGPVAEGS